MDRFSKLKEDLVDFLQDSFSADEVSVMGEFPLAARRAAPRGCSIAVGLAGVELPARSVPPGQVRLTVRFDILCPSETGQSCHALFHRLCDALVCRNRQFSVGEITCGELSYDANLSALLLTAKTTINGILLASSGEDGVPIKDIVIQTKGKSYDG